MKDMEGMKKFPRHFRKRFFIFMFSMSFMVDFRQ